MSKGPHCARLDPVPVAPPPKLGLLTTPSNSPPRLHCSIWTLLPLTQIVATSPLPATPLPDLYESQPGPVFFDTFGCPTLRTSWIGYRVLAVFFFFFLQYLVAEQSSEAQLWAHIPTNWWLFAIPVA